MIVKKIAMFSDSWGRRNTYERASGVHEAIKECEEEIVLHRYNSYGNWSADHKYNLAEYSIYKLPDMKDFDGAIIETNNIFNDHVVDGLYEKLKNSKLPVIDMTKETEGFYYSGLDNKGIIYKMVKHMYEDHGCRTFVYAGGPEENYENQKRRDGFLLAMEKYVFIHILLFISGIMSWAIQYLRMHDFLN